MFEGGREEGGGVVLSVSLFCCLGWVIYIVYIKLCFLISI